MIIVDLIFSGVHFQTLVAVHPCPVVPQRYRANYHRRAEPILAYSTPYAQVYKYVTVIFEINVRAEP